MRAERIWPNGLRYLWTDAFGVVLYVSPYRELGDPRWLGEAEALVSDVGACSVGPAGLRIGEAADRDGQYFHYLAMWLFALARLGAHKPDYHVPWRRSSACGSKSRAISVARRVVDDQIRIHQLWRLLGPASRERSAQARRSTQRVLRKLALR